MCGRLVRDNIPKIYENEGKVCVTERLEMEEYAERLIEVLDGKMQDFKSAFEMQDDENAVNEIAEVVEVLYAVLNLIGVEKESFEKIRLAKCQKFGGYDNRVLLKEVLEKQD